MKIKTKIMVPLAIVILFLLAWAPWITNDYAINKVFEKLGGPEASFNYLGEEIAVKDVPKEVGWFPFGKSVLFPSEAEWFVTFYGDII